MIVHIMGFENNEAGEVHCALIGVFTLARLHILTLFFGGSDTYFLETNVLETQLILNFIF